MRECSLLFAMRHSASALHSELVETTSLDDAMESVMKHPKGFWGKYGMWVAGLLTLFLMLGSFIIAMASAGNTPEDKQLKYYGGTDSPVAITEVLDLVRKHPDRVIRVNRHIAKGAAFAERVAVDGKDKSVWSITTQSDDEALTRAVQAVNETLAEGAKIPISNQPLQGQSGEVNRQGPAGETGLRYWGPVVVQWGLIIGTGFGLWYLIRRASGGTGVMGNNQSPARALELLSGEPVTLDDVEGIDEIKGEITDWINDIKDRTNIAKLGGEPRKAVLLVGPPGVGKTYLVRAITHECDLPGLFMSGADFMEKYVGVGPQRVRMVFSEARKLRDEKGACFLIVDEIEALLKNRASSERQGNDEGARTLNTWLAEMDGMADVKNIFFVGMTNLPEVMDPAATRPGRFGYRIEIPYPDADGKEKILKVHARGVPLAEDVDFREIARDLPARTSGATIRDIIKDRAPSMTRKLARLRHSQATAVTKEAILRAAEEIEFGAAISEARSLRLPEDFKEVVRKHETGHLTTALVLHEMSSGLGNKWGHQVKLISGMGPAGTGGFVKTAASDNLALMSETELRAWMILGFGGTMAETLFIGRKTVGNQNDLEQVNRAADQMVTMFDMSPDDELPAVSVPRRGDSKYLGGGGEPQYDGLSDRSMAQIDHGKAKHIRDAKAKARAILQLYAGFFEYFHPELAKAPGLRMYTKEIYEHWNLWNRANPIVKPDWLTNRELWESYWDYRCPQPPTLDDLKALKARARVFPALADLR